MASVITTNTDKIAKPTNQFANAVSGVKGSNEAEYHTGLVNITPSSIGLGNVDNTSDADKPISTAVQTALEGKQNTISDLETIRANAGAGASAYQKPGTGIPSSDMSSAVQTSLGKADSAYAALSSKQDALVSGTNIKTINNTSLLGSGNIAISSSDGIASITTSQDGTIVITLTGGDTYTINFNHTHDGIYTPVTSTIPQTGLLPNVVYDYGTTDTVSVTLNTTGLDNTIANEWHFFFTAQTTSCAVTLPSGVELGNEYSWDLQAGVTYEVSIMNNIAYVGSADLSS